MAADGLICEGDHLVLDVNGEKLSFVQKLKATSKIRVGKHFVPAAPLIGAPYGALFEVTNDGTLQRVLLPPSDEITRITETEKNNSGLFDRNSENQKLTQEEIEELKKSGKAGAEIIQALCSNSATFQNKTEFSQDKYRKRKAKKYLTYLTVRKPTGRILCEAYYDKGAERVSNLRHDSLALLMSLANVAAGAKVLVAEQCAGVLTAAAVERLGGLGTVCALQLDERPAPLDAVRLMNLSLAQRASLFTAPAGSLLRDKEAADKGQLYMDSAGHAAAGEKLAEPQHGPCEPPPAGNSEEAAAAAPPASSSAPDDTLSAMDVDGSQAGGSVPDAEGAAVVKQEAAAPVADGETAAAAVATTDGDAAAAATMTFFTSRCEGVKDDAMVVEAVAAAGADGEAVVVEAEAKVTAAAVVEPQQPSGQQQPAVQQQAEPQQPEGPQQHQQAQRREGGYGSFLPRPEVLRAVLTAGFDSCLLAIPRVHPTAALAAIWPLLAPSATFAVFSPWPQPLAEALSHLQASRNAVLLQLQESWLRPYQVLPARTHPHMSCSGTGGFILSGIKVVPPDATPLERQLDHLYLQAQLQSQLQQPQAEQERGGGGAAAAEGAAVGEDEEAPKEDEETQGADGKGGAGEEAAGGGRGRGRGWGRNGNGNSWRGGGDGGGRYGGGRWGNGRDGGRGRDGGGGARGRWNSDGGGGFRGRGGGGGWDGGRGGGKRKAEGGGGDYSRGGKRQAT